MKLVIALLLVGATSLNWGACTFAQALETGEIKQTATINFSGGKLSEYIDLVREKKLPAFNSEGEMQPMNIFITEDARNVRMPSVEMTTTFDGFLGILSTISNERQKIIVDSTNDVTRISVDNRNLTRVQVINAKQLLEKMDKEDLLSAIEIGMQMQGNEGAIELKLHEQTGLLFVKGPHENTELVGQIVAELYQANGGGFGAGSVRDGGGIGGSGGDLGGTSGLEGLRSQRGLLPNLDLGTGIGLGPQGGDGRRKGDR